MYNLHTPPLLVEELKKKLSVNTVQFVLFLYLQNAPRSSLKTPMVAAEEYPIQFTLRFLSSEASIVLDRLTDGLPLSRS